MQIPPCDPQSGVDQKFPVELIEYIIDHLHDDKRSLSSCGLVSQSFARASQYHLFRSLTCKSSGQKWSYTYINVFFEQHPHLGPLVQEIVFLGDPPDSAVTEGVICICSVSSILHCFPRLSSVTFTRTSLEVCSDQCKLHERAPIPLKELILTAFVAMNAWGPSGVSDKDTPHSRILSFFNLFASIERLNMHRVNVPLPFLNPTSVELDESQLVCNLQIKNLMIVAGFGGDYNRRVAPLLNAAGVFRNIERLDYKCSASFDLQDVLAIATTSVKTLKSLSLHVAEGHCLPVTGLTYIPDLKGENKLFVLPPSDSLKLFQLEMEVPPLHLSQPGGFNPGICQPAIDLAETATRHLTGFTLELVLNFEHVYDHSKNSPPVTALSRDFDWEYLVETFVPFEKMEMLELTIRFGQDINSGETVSQCKQFLSSTAIGPWMGKKIRVSFEAWKPHLNRYYHRSEY